MKYRVRHYVFAAFIFAVGFLACDFKHYLYSLQAKAAICEATQCERAANMAEALKLPEGK